MGMDLSNLSRAAFIFWYHANVVNRERLMQKMFTDQKVDK